METAFTPLLSLGGGLLIGVSTVLLMLSLGRVMGATGILNGILQPAGGQDFSWRAAILLGMMSGPVALGAIFGMPATIQVVSSAPMLVVSGLLVGVGVTYGGGCTSGHGICGNARLSARSIVATVTFMLATFITVFVLRHVVGV
ncbi:YeeE/YedE family protein [Pukyongiella litopenaei]|uniref:YeeE/YedE family protein n=1 Tax=Pukyongiella litopenaei TaxID=2605946 RepID=A0A2S0MNN4_9RHOB|nr:hypothetical protein [Pukyongiella litopenaei]AVO37447.1 YeeE/YedE family protein [Pukyongiella litopenaei]